MERTEQDMIENKRAENTGLYDPSFEHDNCGIGAVVNIKGIKTHDTVNNALKIVENLEHRAGKDAEGKTGDGVGILLVVALELEFKRAARHIQIVFRDLLVVEILHDLIILKLFLLLLPCIEGNTGDYKDGYKNIRYPCQRFSCAAVGVFLVIFQTSNHSYDCRSFLE